MSDTAETPAAEAAPEAPKAPKIELRKNNDVTEPRPGSKTRRIWDIANEIGAKKGAPATLAEVKEGAAAEGLNESTIQTQYNRYRRFYDLPPQGRPAKAAPAEQAPAATEAAE